MESEEEGTDHLQRPCLPGPGLNTSTHSQAPLIYTAAAQLF